MNIESNPLVPLFLFATKQNFEILIRFKIVEMIINESINYSVSEDETTVFLKQNESQDRISNTDLVGQELIKIIGGNELEYHQSLKKLRKLNFKRIKKLLEVEFDIEFYKPRIFLKKLFHEDELTNYYLDQKTSLANDIKEICKKCRKRDRDYNMIYSESINRFKNTLVLTTTAKHMLMENISNKSLFHLHTKYLVDNLKYSDEDAETSTYLFDYLLKSIDPIKKTSLGLENFSLTGIDGAGADM